MSFLAAGRLPAVAAAVVLLLSCSIKEDRSGCPCRLRLEFPEEASSSGRAILSVRNNMGFSHMDTLDFSEIGGVYELSVPRTGVRVNLWSDDAAGFVGDDGLVIPFGDDCPYVRMYSSSLDTGCEICVEQVKLRKNYCRLTVMIDEDDEAWPFEMNVIGNVAGYGIDGSPCRGEFSHYLVASSVPASGQVTARHPLSASEGELSRELSLPRQTDSSLRLSVMEGYSELKTFALGNYISASGYDWTADDLQDIVVRIDYACTKVSITVGPWEHSYDVNIEF